MHPNFISVWFFRANVYCFSPFVFQRRSSGNWQRPLVSVSSTERMFRKYIKKKGIFWGSRIDHRTLLKLDCNFQDMGYRNNLRNMFSISVAVFDDRENCLELLTIATAALSVSTDETWKVLKRKSLWAALSTKMLAVEARSPTTSLGFWVRHSVEFTHCLSSIPCSNWIYDYQSFI